MNTVKFELFKSNNSNGIIIFAEKTMYMAKVINLGSTLFPVRLLLI
ncbi:hypothetical protein HMPREF1212_04938 [Parabacteroides sp. HGS0025]|nr:hypothetical protein HMPREF1212_04938 [Parabacteroides sp. HGS0025]